MYELALFFLSFMQLVWSFTIMYFWFKYRYESITQIEREKFIVQDPERNPDL